MVTNGNVTGLVERLESEGFVVRETPDGDRRVTVARLTRKGEEVFSEMARAHEAWLKDMFADVPEEALRALLEDMSLVKASVNNHLSGAEDD
jgi:DNA-binding MarR family transcriptional regulator